MHHARSRPPGASVTRDCPDGSSKKTENPLHRAAGPSLRGDLALSWRKTTEEPVYPTGRAPPATARSTVQPARPSSLPATRRSEAGDLALYDIMYDIISS